MSGQSIRFASFPVSSVAPAGFYHTLPPHPPSLPGFVSLTAYPHPRRHLSPCAVFGSSFDAHTALATPRRTPGKTLSAAHASGHRIRSFIQTPRSLDKHDEAGNETTTDGTRNETRTAWQRSKQADPHEASYRQYRQTAVENFFVILPAGLMNYQQVINRFSTVKQ